MVPEYWGLNYSLTGSEQLRVTSQHSLQITVTSCGPGAGVCFLCGRRADLSGAHCAVNQLSVDALTMFPLCSAAAAQSGLRAERLPTCVFPALTLPVCVFCVWPAGGAVPKQSVPERREPGAQPAGQRQLQVSPGFTVLNMVAMPRAGFKISQVLGGALENRIKALGFFILSIWWYLRSCWQIYPTEGLFSSEQNKIKLSNVLQQTVILFCLQYVRI